MDITPRDVDIAISGLILVFCLVMLFRMRRDSQRHRKRMQELDAALERARRGERSQ